MKLRFWPYESFTVETKEGLPELLEKLRPHVGPAPFFPWSKRRKEFAGTVTEAGFKMYRAIRYHNSFLPVMIGVFDARPEGTCIIVRMRLHGYTLAFLIVSLGFLAKFTWDLLGAEFQFDASFFWGLGIPTTFVVAVYLMTIFGFSFEADRSRELALKILTGRSSNDELRTDG